MLVLCAGCSLVQKIVEDGELLGGVGEAGLLALAVVGDQPLAKDAQSPHRYPDPAHVAAGAAVLGEGAPQDEAVV